MVLSDKKLLKCIIDKKIIIDPFDKSRLGDTSYDLTLNPLLIKYTGSMIDLKEEASYEEIRIPDDGLIIQPDECYLGLTNEIAGSNHYKPYINGKSSLGRYFLEVHQTAGWGDVGFINRWVLEIRNNLNIPIKIYHGIPVCQIEFHMVGGKIVNPYNKRKNAKYNDLAEKPVVSKYYKNF